MARFHSNLSYMKQKIISALSAEYKGLGLSENTIGRLADYIVSKGSVTKEEEIDAAVKGEDVKLLATSIQGEIAGIKRAKETAESALADYKAKHPEQDPAQQQQQQPDLAKTIADAVAAAVAPLTEKVAALETVNSTKAALATARESFFGGDYAKKYKEDADEAWERAVEINELTGNKMTAEELTAKATSYFNKAVSKKGVDINKPFVADPPAGEDEGTTDWSAERQRQIDEGRIPAGQ